jgi:hypothetical protein
MYTEFLSKSLQERKFLRTWHEFIPGDNMPMQQK